MCVFVSAVVGKTPVSNPGPVRAGVTPGFGNLGRPLGGGMCQTWRSSQAACALQHCSGECMVLSEKCSPPSKN